MSSFSFVVVAADTLIGVFQVIARGLQKLVTFELVDYRDFAKQHPGEFDRIISCEMVRAIPLCFESTHDESVQQSDFC